MQADGGSDSALNSALTAPPMGGLGGISEVDITAAKVSTGQRSVETGNDTQPWIVRADTDQRTGHAVVARGEPTHDMAPHACRRHSHSRPTGPSRRLIG